MQREKWNINCPSIKPYDNVKARVYQHIGLSRKTLDKSPSWKDNSVLVQNVSRGYVAFARKATLSDERASDDILLE